MRNWQMKSRFFSSIAIASFATLCVAQLASASGLTVLTVPWIPATPTSPHSTYSISTTTESKIVLGATVPSAVGSTDVFEAVWSFGDASPNVTINPVTNPYDISTTHQYPASAAVGTTWTATVTVTDLTNPASGSANYYVFQEANSASTPALILQSKVNIAIDWGLWYMHQTEWRGTTTVGTTTVNWGGWDQQTVACPLVNDQAYDCAYYGVIDAENVQAFEVNGHLQNGPATDPFTDDVARGLARMFKFLATQPAGSDTYTYNPATANYSCEDGSYPTTGDPTCTGHGGQVFYNASATSCLTPNCVFTFDANKNSLQTYSNDGSGEYTYTTSPFMEAMIAAGTPTATAPTGPVGVQGETFQTIVQDLADFYNYSQYGYDYDVSQGDTRGDSQYQGGAWLYGPQQGDDNSTSQWAAIGLIAANRGFGISVPPIVTDTNNVWITNSQDVQDPAPTGTNSFLSHDNAGAYGYRGSWTYSQEWGPFAVTPSGMVQMALDGVGRTTNKTFGDATTAFDQRWNNTETFYADNFCNGVYTYGTGGGYTDAYYAPRAYMYGLFSFTKSMLLHDPSFGLAPIQYLRTLTPNVFTTNSSIPKNTIDWYAALSPANGGTDPCDGVAQTLVTFQSSPVSGTFDGHWWGNTSDVGANTQSPFETSWALIMLQKTVFVSCVNNLQGRGTPAGANPARVDLTWSAQGQANSYDVLRGTIAGGPYTEVGTTTTTAYSDTTGLKGGGTYYYVLQPVNASNTEICQSNQATVTIPAGR
jgi:hypothetical protein